MSERYIRLFSLDENLYTDNSPLVIRAGALLKDTQTGGVISQLKLQNLSDKLITYVKLCITQLDPAKVPIGEPIYFEYMDLNVSQGEMFGPNVAIKLPNASTRSFLVGVIKVAFNNGDLWNNEDTNWKMLSDDSPILHLIRSEDTYKTALKLSNSNTKDDILQAIEILETLKDVKDTTQEISYCKDRLATFERLNKEKQEKVQKKQEKVQKIKQNAISLIPSFLFIVVAVIDLLCRSFNRTLGATTATILFCSYLLVFLICIAFFVWSGLKAIKNGVKNLLFSSLSAIAALVTSGTIFVFPESDSTLALSHHYTAFESNVIVLLNTILILSALFLIYTIFKNKIIKGVLVLSGVICIFGVIFSFYVSPFVYSQNTEGYTLTTMRIIPISGDVEVPKTHNNKPVTQIERYCFMDSYIKTIKIPNSVTNIDSYAFNACKSLTSVTLPDSVTNIGAGVFERCYSLTNITLPNSITNINNNTFRSCTSLTSITIPDSVTSIGNGAFEYCYSLTNITLPNSVKTIDSYAFSACRSLTSVTIPSSVTEINFDAFANCTSLTSVIFMNPNGWWYASRSTATSGTSFSSRDLSNPSTSATYLTSTYSHAFWHHN